MSLQLDRQLLTSRSQVGRGGMVLATPTHPVTCLSQPQNCSVPEPSSPPQAQLATWGKVPNIPALERTQESTNLGPTHTSYPLKDGQNINIAEAHGSLHGVGWQNPEMGDLLKATEQTWLCCGSTIPCC